MKLINTSRKTIIAKDLKIAKSTADRMLGLLKRSNPRNLMFETRFGVHTFFLKVPIDVVVMSTSHKVVKICEDLSPNRIFIYGNMSPYVVELARGSIKKSKTKIGDKLKLVD